ncbi:phage fiber-tail adaptor protein [Acetobacter persici]|uniref:phage fiber-tail adaptor protein n=1 Tax=Acetobacter persici TaxID=1076596 RepID=UPI001BA6824C|nr:hypothetical protein [Acetobacter persici]MBS0962966.1 hypothetical protein [Acetobacter persici]
MTDLVLPGGLTPDPARIWHVTPVHAQGAWPVKSSPDALDYGVDFSAFLSGAGDTIRTHTVSVITATGSTYDLTSVWDAHDESRVLMMLGSGTPATMQRVRVQIATAQNRRFEQTMRLWIVDYSAASGKPLMALPTGEQLTTPDGTPLSGTVT